MLVVFFISLAVLGAGLLVPGLDDLLLLGVPCVIASLLILLTRLSSSGSSLIFKKRWIILDGSNIMHWKGNGADIATVQDAIQKLSEQGYTPGVVFDANVGYKLRNRYQGEAELAKLLDLPVARVMVVSKGTPADQVILAAARDHNAQVVTNDRFRDWSHQHPEVKDEGHLVRGGYRAGRLWLDLPPAKQQ
ncbi:NYN domain-containing protein [Sagittula salina]|uniref:RNase NYN domain-containing protein n=1 Tax=Sagittula salina TaxID=2820268 RepID=A0A940MIF9_9RHOB|nr:hypothetical protein [Sagittula salina]MBP0482096.1 hypothetical protein [Sagittula salina]